MSAELVRLYLALCPHCSGVCFNFYMKSEVTVLQNLHIAYSFNAYIKAVAWISIVQIKTDLKNKTKVFLSYLFRLITQMMNCCCIHQHTLSTWFLQKWKQICLLSRKLSLERWNEANPEWIIRQNVLIMLFKKV